MVASNDYTYTRPRRPVAASYTSPGPCYALPTLTGHTAHDPRSPHTRGPSYQFGLPFGPEQAPCSPGPCYWTDPRVCRMGRDGSPSYSLYGRPKELEVFKTPGPGAYPYHRSRPLTKPRAPAYTFGSVWSSRGADEKPGPNVYTIPAALGRTVESRKLTAPAFSIYGRSKIGNFYDDIRKTPAPGAYHVITPDQYKTRAPQYSITGKNIMPGDATAKPGPGAHSPERLQLGQLMDFVEACLDEIALEGLDGITLSALWIRLSTRKPCLSLTLDDLAKEYLWSTVLRGNENVGFYELPKPRPPLVLYDRFKDIDLETGVIVRMDDHPEDIYPICVIKDDPDGIMGSCLDFHTRKNVTAIVQNKEMDLNSVLQRWGEKFVIVASQRLRATALFGCRQVDPDVLLRINDIKYAILERIGRARCHGEVTQSRDGLKVFKVQPKSMFYIRKILRNMGLITVQPVCIRSPHCNSINGKLIHLTRFFIEFRPKYMVLLEGLTSRLAAKTHQREQLSQIRSEMGVKEQTFKKLLNLGKNHVKSEMMKFKDAFPESIENPHLKKLKNVERSVRVLQLIKPYNVIENCDDDDDDENEKFGREKDDESEKDLEELDLTVAVGKDFSSKGSSTNLLCERPVLHQILSCIEMLGGRGQSLVDLATRYGITKLDSRVMCRNLSRKGRAITVMQDEGKNRVTRYVSKRAITNASTAATRPVEEASREASNATSLIENKEEEDACLGNSVNQTVKATQVTECEAVTADEKEKEELLKLFEVFPDATTIRTLRRAKTILTAIEQARVVSDSVLIQKKIRAEEATASMMDRKSFTRLIEKLCRGNKIRKIVNTLQMSNGQKKELVFLCSASVTDDDLLVQSALEAARQKLITAKTESKSSQNVVKDESAALKSSQVDIEDGVQYDTTACKRHGYLSRMARLRTLHQLLWSLVYGKHEDLSPQNATLMDQGQTASPVARETTSSLLCDDFYSTPETEENSDEYLASHYTMMSWHRTLPQLPKHQGYDEGWCCVFDVLQVIPISIICQIISLPYAINGLDRFLSDPVSCNTPYNKLPVEWQKILSRKRRYITHFYSDCKFLALLGLLTFGKRDFKQKEQCFMYIHKRATLVNTTRSDIPRSEFPICSFNFETFENVEDYWLSLQSLSFNTPRENLLSFTKPRLSNEDGRFDDCLMEREVGSVVDNGVQPGDGMGGAGTDSTFFSHLRRNWSHNTDIDVKMESLINDGQYLINERASTRALQGKMKKKHVQVDAVEEVQPTSKKSITTKNDPNVKFTKEVVTGVVPKKGGKGVKRKRNGVVEGLLKKSKRVRDKRAQSTDADKLTTAVVEIGRRRYKHDSKDVDAIRLLKRHRVTWTPQEDSLLLLCQLANQFLSGYQKLCLVGSAVIRDIMHENLAVSRDKTRLACIRRIKYMMKNSVTVQNVRMYLGEALLDKELLAEFKDGKKYTVKNSVENGPVFRRCLANIREKFRCESESVPDIPNTLAEVVERLSDVKSAGYRKSTHQDITCVSEIFYSVLHNLIHSVIVLTDKIGRSRELFQLLYQYPESVVESVFKTMKNDRILTKIKKSMAKKSRTGGIPLTRFGTFQISQRYMYYWHSNYIRNIFSIVGSSVQQFPPHPDDFAYGSDFLVLRNTMSHSVMTVTLMSLRLVTFETTIPEQIIIIDTMSKEEKTVEQPKKKRKMDDESDLEEEALIEVAERDEVQEALMQDDQGTSVELPDSTIASATPSVIMYSKSQSSRTVLSYYRCQYVHSKSVRLINANDNIFINACNVRMRLKPNELRDVNSGCETAWASDVEAHRNITDWNQSHIMLHPKTCLMILKSIRSLFPDRTQPNMVLNICLARSKDKGLMMSVFEEIKRREYLGLTIYQLRETFSGIDGRNLMDHLAVMVDCKLLVRVGVTVFRYVCLEFASSWLIRIDKNLKGRGCLIIDEEDDVWIDPWEDSSATDDPSSNADASPSSSSAVSACSSPISRGRTSQLSTEIESSLQFVPSPHATAKKRQRSEVEEGKIREDVELPESERMEEPPLKCPKLSEVVSQETCLQLGDGKEVLECTEESVSPSTKSLQLREDNLEPSSNSLQLSKETFVTDTQRTVAAAESFKPSAEHVELIGENSETDSQRLTASDNTLSSSVNFSKSPKVGASDVKNKTEIIQSNTITSDFMKPTSDSQLSLDGIVYSPNVSVSQTLVNALPSLLTSVQFKPSVADITEQQAVVTHSYPCTIPESTSLISCVDASTAKSAASHTSKSPARESTVVSNTSTTPSCKGTPVTRHSNLLAGKGTPVTNIATSPVCKSTPVTSASKPRARKSTPVSNSLKSPAGKITPVTNTCKSPVRKRTPVASALKSPARKSTSVSNALKSPAGKITPVTNTSKSPGRKRTPVASASKSPACKSTVSNTLRSPTRKSTSVIPPSSTPATRRGLVNPNSAVPDLDTKMASVNAEKSPSVQAAEVADCVSGRINASENEQVKENPNATEVTDDSYFSSLINSVPKVLKRPRDFLKNKPSSERRGRLAPNAPKSPRPIRLPSWMSPAKETELTSVQKLPSSATSLGKHRTRLSSASEAAFLEAPETRTDQNVLKTAVTTIASNSNSTQSVPAYVTRRRKSSLSSPRSESTVSPSPLLPPVAAAQGSMSPMSTTPRSKQPITPIVTAPNRKTLPVVRMATSGTCTTITVVSPERESNELDEDSTKAETSSIYRGSNVRSPLSASPSVATVNQSAVTRNSEKARVTSETMYSSAAESQSGALPQRSTDRFVGSKKTIAAESSEGMSSMSAQHRTVTPSNQFSPRLAMGSPQFHSPSSGICSIPTAMSSSPSTPGGQAIRIRVPASSLTSVSGTSDLARQIQEMLTKQGSLKPGQQVRLRLPPGVTLQNLGLDNTALCPGQSVPSPGQPRTAVDSSGQLVVSAGTCVASSGQPVVSSGQPVVSSGQPVVSSGHPVVSSGQPVVSSGHPVVSSGQPVVSSCQPVVSSGHPVVSCGQPRIAVVSSSQLVTGNNASVTNQGSETSCLLRSRAGAEQETSDRQAGKQSADELSRFRLPQVDGAGDENSMDTSDGLSLVASTMSNNAIGTADNLDNSVATDQTTKNRSLHHVAVASTSDSRELDELCPIQQLENTQNVVESPLPANRRDGRRSTFQVPAPTGTYKKVRLIPRPWRTPEGTINRPTLQTMLEAVMLFIIETPGVTRGALIEKYNPVLQPVAIFELLEMLEEIGCLQRTYLQRSHRPALFSSRSKYQIVSEDLGKETEVFRPTPCCIPKLGQFVIQLTSNMRNHAR